MSDTKRPCRACEGSGRVGCYLASTYHRHVSPWTGNPTTYHRHACDIELCPACAGRGWQSDAMPIADALADAETLLAYSDLLSRAAWAARMGTDAVRRAKLGYETTAPDRARKAARNAFAAVPGLRG